MTTQLPSTAITFQERMFERMRKDMGELMTDEELKKIVEQAMNDAFFKKPILGEGWNKKEGDPPIYAIIKSCLADRIKIEVESYMRTHNDEITKAVEVSLAKGFSTLVLQHLDSVMSLPLIDLMNNLRNRGIIT